MSDKLDAIKAKLPQSEHGNFRVKDTIGVPHPYMIGAKHVGFAADHHGGMLGEAAIEAGERQGIVCEICKGKLTYKQHETAILIECDFDVSAQPEHKPELHAYLLALKPMVEEAKYAGFAFMLGKV